MLATTTRTTEHRADLYPTRREGEKIIDRADPMVFGDGAPRGKRSLSREELESYEENGFLIFPEYFSSDEVGLFLEEFERLKRSGDLRGRDELVLEPESSEVRSIFGIHRFSGIFDRLSRDSRILDKATQILGGDVYIHHSRINVKKGFVGKGFPWHSDFETWHAEDGLPRARVLTAWVMLTENNEYNGPLFVIPGSQDQYVCCAGRTPPEHHRESLRRQRYGSPSPEAVEELMRGRSLAGVYGHPGTLVFHEGNIMHGSPDNISPMPRTNVFFVYNSVRNAPAPRPYAAARFRPDFLSEPDTAPLKTVDVDQAR